MLGRDTNGRRGHLDTFWTEAVAVKDSVTLQITRDAILFTLWAVLVYEVDRRIPSDLGVGITPFEAAGVALGLLLVLRTNAGYDRWWEARKLWGGITNHCRCLAATAVVQGPQDPAWRSRTVRLTAAFAHVMRRALRGQRDMPEVAALLGPEETERFRAARHMPVAVLTEIAAMLREAREVYHVNVIPLNVADLSRVQLFDLFGGCERILKAPIPRVYSIQIRRLIVLFLATLPFGLLEKTGWLTPLVTFLVSYPILAIDQIGAELQNPFHPDHLGHLPLDDITATIEGDLLALLEENDGRDFRASVGADNLSIDGAGVKLPA